MLHLRYNNNISTFVIFADLVKAFDIFNQKLIRNIFKKYSFPPRLCFEIRGMYMYNKVRLFLGNIDTSIPFEVEVKQGDSVAPVLFLFIMVSFAETLEKEWVRNGLKVNKFKQQSNSLQSSGIITSHHAKTFSNGTLYEKICMLYVDDGAFSFETI